MFSVWAAIAILSGAAAAVGNALFRSFSASIIAGTTATAAGAILAMITDTMMPEAFEYAYNLSGLVTVLGFLSAFVLSNSAREVAVPDGYVYNARTEEIASPSMLRELSCAARTHLS